MDSVKKINIFISYIKLTFNDSTHPYPPNGIIMHFQRLCGYKSSKIGSVIFLVNFFLQYNGNLFKNQCHQ